MSAIAPVGRVNPVSICPFSALQHKIGHIVLDAAPTTPFARNPLDSQMMGPSRVTQEDALKAVSQPTKSIDVSTPSLPLELSFAQNWTLLIRR